MPKSNFDDVIESGVVVLRSLLSFLLRTLQLGWKIVASNLRIFRKSFCRKQTKAESFFDN